MGSYIRTLKHRKKMRLIIKRQGKSIGKRIKLMWERGVFDKRDFKGKNNPNYGKHHSEKMRKKIGRLIKKTRTPKIRLKLSNLAKKRIGKLNPFYGKHHSEKTKTMVAKKNKINTKRNWKNPIYREKVIRNVFKSLHKKPSFYEKKIIELNKKYNLGYKYTGSGKQITIIGGKIPDFINVNGRKVIIEVYSKGHLGNLKPYNYEFIRSRNFSKYGYTTIFLNENDLFKDDWEEHCLKKLGG